jgi:hypothetical protein
LGQGIHAVGRNDGGRAACQKIRIDQRNLSHQFLVAEGLFETLRALHAQNRILGGLRTGARRGRHRNERGRRADIGQFRAHAFQMIHHRIAGSEQAGNRLGRIQRAAAANADHHIDRFGTQGAHGLVHHLR